MHLRTAAIAALTTSTFLLGSGIATAAKPNRDEQKRSNRAGQGNPRVIGTPSARYTFATSDDFDGRFLSIGVVFRTDRVLDRDDFATIAAPKLRSGQQLPGALFGGTTPLRIGQTSKHCYLGEITQLARHTTASNRNWKFALRDDGTVIGSVKSMTLKRQTDERWEMTAAKRQGC